VTAFSAAELTYLEEGKLGRLATIDARGRPHVVPLGWSYNAERDTIDIGGRNNEASRKYRHVQANPNVGFVVDDVLPPWRPRCVTIRGTAEVVPAGTEAPDQGALIRVTPTQVTSWGLEES